MRIMQTELEGKTWLYQEMGGTASVTESGSPCRREARPLKRRAVRE
jgi:hypothetical protein